MKKLFKLATVTVLTVAAFGAASAQTKDAVIFRGGLAFINPTSDSTISGDKFEAKSALGPDFNFEYKINDMFGVEAATFYGKHDVKVNGQKVGKISQLPLLFTGNFHFAASKVDFYAGPTLGYNFWGDLKPTGGGSVSADGEFVYGASAGIDVPFNEKWGFTGGLRYLMSKAAVKGVGDVDVNPLVVRAGVSYRF